MTLGGRPTCRLPLAAAALALLAALAAGPATGQMEESSAAYPHESYNYKQHGLDWPNIYDKCSGTAQSPIDIRTASLQDPATRPDVSALDMGALARSGGAVLGTNVTVNLEQDLQLSWAVPADLALPSLVIDGVNHSFTPVQLHFHHFSSEHALDGMLYPVEAHLVMSSTRNGSSQLAVLGIMYEYAEEGDPFLDRVLNRSLQMEGSFGSTEVDIDLDIDVRNDILPAANLTYAGYDGSLTTPTCDEVVKWHVFLTPRKVSIEQMKAFANITRAANPLALLTNNRIIQDPNGRQVYQYLDLPGTSPPTEDEQRDQAFQSSVLTALNLTWITGNLPENISASDLDLDAFRRTLSGFVREKLGPDASSLGVDVESIDLLGDSGGSASRKLLANYNSKANVALRGLVREGLDFARDLLRDITVDNLKDSVSSSLSPSVREEVDQAGGVSVEEVVRELATTLTDTYTYTVYVRGTADDFPSFSGDVEAALSSAEDTVRRQFQNYVEGLPGVNRVVLEIRVEDVTGGGGGASRLMLNEEYTGRLSMDVLVSGESPATTLSAVGDTMRNSPADIWDVGTLALCYNYDTSATSCADFNSIGDSATAAGFSPLLCAVLLGAGAVAAGW